METGPRLRLELVKEREIEGVEASEQERLEQIRVGTCRVAAD